MSRPTVSNVQLLFEQALLSESDLIRLKARLTAVASRLGFSLTLTERIRLAASELVTNQAKYAGGRGLLQAWEAHIGGQSALDLFALDYGPGLVDADAALVDGYSTGGTLGKGLGGVKRLAHGFGVLTRATSCPDIPWHGTAVWARFQGAAGLRSGDWEWGMYRRSYQDARENGDGFVICVGSGIRVLHLDALGHGPAAADVVDAAGDGFDCKTPLLRCLGDLGGRPRMRRGAAACAYDCDADGHYLWQGIGDMQACMLQGNTRQPLAFSPGVLGQVHGRLSGSEGVWPEGARLATASDGLRTRWPQALSLLGDQPPQLLAYFLGHVLGRTSDDRSCLIVRRGSGGKHGKTSDDSGAPD